MTGKIATDLDGDALTMTLGTPDTTLTSGGKVITWDGVGTDALVGKIDKGLLTEKDIININKLDKININKSYLSSDQINEKDKVLSWSNQILKNVENQIPLARMYFPYIPKNIHKYKVMEKKKLLFGLLEMDPTK